MEEGKARVNFQIGILREKRGTKAEVREAREGGRETSAMQRRRSRFIASQEQHRQNLISGNESLISRKLGSRDLAEFALA